MPRTRRAWAARAAVLGVVAGLFAALTAAVAPAAPSGGRAYELVSPINKNGGDVAADSQRTRAAADGSAVGFVSLVAIGDVQGTGVATDYISVRSTDARPRANGWATHAITPLDRGGSIVSLFAQLEPLYVGEFSDDLDTGIYSARSPLTADPNVANALNFYLRDDLRTPGRGSYELLTACPACEALTTPLPPFPDNDNGNTALNMKPWLAGSSPDFEHIVFESRQLLTSDTPADPTSVRAFEWTGGRVRLVGRIPTLPALECDDVNGPACTPAPVSIAGLGAGASHGPGGVITPNTVSDGSDGHSRIIFTAPSNPSAFNGNIYMRVDGTRTVMLNASERTPGAVGVSTFLGASDDGTRVFFSSANNLVPGITGNVQKLYMYDADTPNDEQQRIVVRATAGQYRLVFGPDTTADIAFNAQPDAIRAALNALPSIGGVGGSVEVSGGIGSASGTNPYTVTFGGSLAGRNQPLMTVAAGTTPLSGGTAIVSDLRLGGGHLTWLSVEGETADGNGALVPNGVVGMSRDGRSVYFVALGQLYPGVPSGPLGPGLYLWRDDVLSFIGQAPSGTGQGELLKAGVDYVLNPRQARVTPDGNHVLFSSVDGAGLLGFDHGRCQSFLGTGCRQLYVYSADTRRLACVSCTRGPATDHATTVVRSFSGGTQTSFHETTALADDGSTVFFSTGNALVPEDTNGRIDAYEYDVATGAVHLLSSGTDPSDSWFMDASADGRDAFFLTRERLVGWDRDGAYDLYDARVGGGFPEPPPVSAPCAGDNCQGSAATPPSAGSSATRTFEGSGNANEQLRRRVRRARRRTRRQCRRGFVKKRVRGRRRCVRARRASLRVRRGS